MPIHSDERVALAWPVHRLACFVLITVFTGTSGEAAGARGKVRPADMTPGRGDFERGQTFYAGGHFIDAAQAFEVAYQRSHNYQMLWNVARAYHRQYEVDTDILNLRRERSVLMSYMQLSPVPREYREARLRLVEVEAALVGAEHAMARSAAASAPSTPAGEAPEPAEPGIPADQRKSSFSSLSPAAPPSPPAPAPVSASPLPGVSRARKIAGYGLLGVGGAFAVGALACGLLGHSDAAALASSGTAQMPTSFDNARDTESAGHLQNNLAYAGIGLGAAALLTGATLLVPWNKLRHADSVSAVVVPVPGGAVVGGTW